MKIKVLCLAAIASTALSSMCFAQQRGHEQDEHKNPAARAEAHAKAAPGARGPEWHRGGRIPASYRNHKYVVGDWRAHHLRQPPHGYQWVQVGGDYVLAAIATGVIADLVLNH